MINANTDAPAPQPESYQAALVKQHARALHLRKSIALANRVKLMADGSRRFVRFNQVEIMEHWILLIAFVILGLTGLLLLFSSLEVVAWTINKVFKGYATLRGIHNAGAILFIALGLFHFVRILSVWIVKREAGSMLPRAKDGSDLGNMLQYNLGMVEERPQFDRYTIEEKLGYWWTLAFALFMVVTGLVLWFPTVITQVLPGDVVQIARTVHQLTAVLGIIAVLTWHLYYTLFRQRNNSIFTGTMSEQAMSDNHPLERRRILAAYEEIQNFSKKE